jgi:hypothetical protein
VVTAPTPELDELGFDVPALEVSPLDVSLLDVPEPEVSPLDVAAVEVVPLDVLADCRASAGSCPLTSVTAISSHRATNSATEPVTTRRRIIRTRAWRAALSEAPRGEGLFVDAIVGDRLARVRSSRVSDG